MKPNNSVCDGTDSASVMEKHEFQHFENDVKGCGK